MANPTLLPQAGSYRTRCVSFLELWSTECWRVKVYGITMHAGQPDHALVLQAKAVAAARLSLAAIEDTKHHGLAVLTVHEGENGDYVLIDWWSDNDIIIHHNYGARKGHSGALTHQWPGPGFCVWELAVTAFERQGWIKHVLMPPGEPDIDAYLAAQLNADV